MVGTMAKIVTRDDNDDLVLRARTDAEALGRLYELYYDRILRFCVYRLFDKEIAEDVTSAVFLAVARQIGGFAGRTEADFRNWLYRITANKTNAYLRKTSRRNKLLAQAGRSMTAIDTNNTDDSLKPDWPSLYHAILKLKPKQQTIVTLRFFENLDFDQIGKVLDTEPATARVTLHRALAKLRNHLQSTANGGK